MKKMNFFAAFAIMMAMGNMNANANMRNARAGELHVNSSGVVYVSNSGHQHDYDYDREYNVRHHDKMSRRERQMMEAWKNIVGWKSTAVVTRQSVLQERLWQELLPPLL